MYIQAQSGVQLGGASLIFFEDKKAPNFGKKGPDYVHLCVQNLVLRVSRGKNSKSISLWDHFLLFLTKRLLKCPGSTKPSLPWKISAGATALRHCFCKTFHLKYLGVFWIQLCLNNCYIQNSAYSDICKHIQAYSALLRHIHTYWDMSNP